MRIHRPASTLSICILASLMASCHGKGRRDRVVDAGADPASILCEKEPFKSTEACKGGIVIQLNTCPVINLTATPLRVAPGQRVTLTGTFLDAEANMVTSEWMADPDGILEVTSPTDAFYTCESIGRKMITVIATDEFDCESSELLEVTCIDPGSFEQAGTDPLPTP